MNQAKNEHSPEVKIGENDHNETISQCVSIKKLAEKKCLKMMNNKIKYRSRDKVVCFKKKRKEIS